MKYVSGVKTRNKRPAIFYDQLNVFIFSTSQGSYFTYLESPYHSLHALYMAVNGWKSPPFLEYRL